MTYSTGPPSTNVYKHRPGPPANHMTSIYRRDLEDTVKRESRVTTLLVIWLGHYRASHYLEVCSHLPFCHPYHLPQSWARLWRVGHDD